MVQVALAGCSGRMGQAILHFLKQYPHITLVGGLVRPGSHWEGKDLGVLGGDQPNRILATSDPNKAFSQADVVIDFTLPTAVINHLDYYVQHRKKVVIGATGFDEAQLKALTAASESLPIVLAPNMSLAVNLCFNLVGKMAKVLKDYDVEIWEAHHRDKKDAPSGTALKLGEAVAQAKGLALKECANLDRHQKATARGAQEIGFATTRGGSIFGDHTVMFAGDYERLELTHRAQSREAFAQGALVAALWLAEQGPGMYSMQDVLGLE